MQATEAPADRQPSPLGRSAAIKALAMDPSLAQKLGKPEREVEGLLAEEGLSGRTVVVKVRYDDFTSITRQRSFESPVSSKDDILAAAAELLKKTEAGRRKIRLLGVTVTGFPQPETEDDGPVQLTFPF